mmetsp:Transcript_9523/g.13968  ORF Transcript_9523/g.13968 Transcript_9523/m.13968 type:complete len:228 (-) Transcript_9523:362-1045(-)
MMRTCVVIIATSTSCCWHFKRHGQIHKNQLSIVCFQNVIWRQIMMTNVVRMQIVQILHQSSKQSTSLGFDRIHVIIAVVAAFWIMAIIIIIVVLHALKHTSSSTLRHNGVNISFVFQCFQTFENMNIISKLLHSQNVHFGILMSTSSSIIPNLYLALFLDDNLVVSVRVQCIDWICRCCCCSRFFRSIIYTIELNSIQEVSKLNLFRLLFGATTIAMIGRLFVVRPL